VRKIADYFQAPAGAKQHFGRFLCKPGNSLKNKDFLELCFIGTEPAKQLCQATKPFSAPHADILKP
jgi:hypothetical protein